MAPKFCIKCGAPLLEGKAFCTKCGAQIHQPKSNDVIISADAIRASLGEKKKVSFAHIAQLILLFAGFGLILACFVISFLPSFFGDYSDSHSYSLYSAVKIVPNFLFFVITLLILFANGIVLIVFELLKKQKQTVVTILSFLSFSLFATFGVCAFYLYWSPNNDISMHFFNVGLLAIIGSPFYLISFVLNLIKLLRDIKVEPKPSLKRMILLFTFPILIVGACFGFVGGTALVPASIYYTGDFSFDLNNDGQSYIIMGYRGQKSHLIIPSEHNGLPVVSIRNNIFQCDSSFKQITFSDNLSTIGSEAFRYSYSLEEINFGKNISYIERDAFDSCDKLTTVNFNHVGCSIGFRAFSSCHSLTSIVLPHSDDPIDKDIFAGTPIEKVFYEGTKHDWYSREVNSDNEELFSAIAFYSETSLPGTDRYWHYVDGVPTLWE